MDEREGANRIMLTITEHDDEVMWPTSHQASKSNREEPWGGWEEWMPWRKPLWVPWCSYILESAVRADGCAHLPA